MAIFSEERDQEPNATQSLGRVLFKEKDEALTNKNILQKKQFLGFDF